MNYGLAAWGLRLTPLREQLAMTKRLGLDLLELGINGFSHDLLQWNSPECAIETVKQLFQESKVSILCAATGNDFTCVDEKETLDFLRKTLSVLKIAEKLGIRYLRIFSGFAPVEEVTGKRYELLRECLKQVYGSAAGTGVLPVVETHGGVEVLEDGSVRHFSSISTEDHTLCRLLDEVEGMCLNFDPANLSVLNKDVCNFYRRYKEKIAYAHLKDFTGYGQGWQPAPCGAGPIDWKVLLNEMRNFHGPAMLEYEIPANAEDGFRLSLEYLQDKEKDFAN